MADHFQQTLADLQKSVLEDERKLFDKKRLVNQLAQHAGMPAVYAGADLQPSLTVSIALQSDAFYGQPLASSIRTILEMRKALNQGPATVNDIYASLVEGGYAFETRNEDNAKRGLRVSTSKNTALFHKLPNGKYGLLDWYPGVKQPKGGKQHEAGDETEEEEATEPGGVA